MKSPAPLPRCPQCKGPMPKPGRTGRPRRWCSDACRRAASRARLRRSTWQAAGELAAPPADPLTHRRRTLEGLAQLLEGRPAAPPEEQLAQALTDLPQVVFTLRRITPELTPNLAARAGRLAEDVDEAMRRSFAEVIS